MVVVMGIEAGFTIGDIVVVSVVVFAAHVDSTDQKVRGNGQ